MSKFMSGLKSSLKSNLDMESLGSAVGDAMGTLGSAAGGVAGGLISNGLESEVGSVFNTVGNIASAIPGPWGAMGGLVAKTAGGLINAVIGTKVDQAKLNAANQGTAYLNNFVSDADYFDDIQGPQAQAAVQNAYTGGIFSGARARRKNAALREERRLAQSFANRSVENNIENIAGEQMNNMLANYAAFGGPLDFGLFPIGGAIDYELAQRRLAQKDLESKKALGGPLHTHGADWTNGITVIDNGGTHEQNPFEGVPMGIAPDGQPNLVEEGEVIFNDYVFSNRIKVPKAVRKKYKLRGQKNMTFADAAKKAQKESEERPNDPISQRGLEDIMYRLMEEQEAIRESRQQRKYSEGGKIHIAPSKRGTFTAAASKHGMGVQEFASKVLANPEDYSPVMRKKANFARNASKWKHAKGGPVIKAENPLLLDAIYEKGKVPLDFSIPIDKQIKSSVNVKDIPMLLSEGEQRLRLNALRGKNNSNYLTGLRYMPAIGAGLGVFSDLMGWTNKPDYSNADSIINVANTIRDANYTPIGDYLTYRPLDRLFYANQLGAQAGATRRNILNTSGGNRGTAMAGLLAADYNAQGQLGNLFRQAEEYNLGQRERVANFNRATNMFNAENNLKAQMANMENAKIKVDAAARAAAIRDAVDARVGAARSANLTNLFDSLGNIGREEVMKSWINNNNGIRYNINLGGEGVTYKRARAANGGLLTIAKKKRRR